MDCYDSNESSYYLYYCHYSSYSKKFWKIAIACVKNQIPFLLFLSLNKYINIRTMGTGSEDHVNWVSIKPYQMLRSIFSILKHIPNFKNFIVIW